MTSALTQQRTTTDSGTLGFTLDIYTSCGLARRDANHSAVTTGTRHDASQEFIGITVPEGSGLVILAFDLFALCSAWIFLVRRRILANAEGPVRGPPDQQNLNSATRAKKTSGPSLRGKALCFVRLFDFPPRSVLLASPQPASSRVWQPDRYIWDPSILVWLRNPERPHSDTASPPPRFRTCW